MNALTRCFLPNFVWFNAFRRFSCWVLCLHFVARRSPCSSGTTAASDVRSVSSVKLFKFIVVFRCMPSTSFCVCPHRIRFPQGFADHATARRLLERVLKMPCLATLILSYPLLFVPLIANLDVSAARVARRTYREFALALQRLMVVLL